MVPRHTLLIGNVTCWSHVVKAKKFRCMKCILQLYTFLFSENSMPVSPSSLAASLAPSAASNDSGTVTLDLNYTMFSNIPGNTIQPTATSQPSQPLQTINSSGSGKSWSCVTFSRVREERWEEIKGKSVCQIFSFFPSQRLPRA